jgi:hypothetical protein
MSGLAVGSTKPPIHPPIQWAMGANNSQPSVVRLRMHGDVPLHLIHLQGVALN